jgi:hypothetical protein
LFPAVLLSLFQQGPVTGPGTDSTNPVLVAKGPGYYLHAIPGAVGIRAAFLGSERVGIGLGLFHTTAESGAMRLLMASGTTVVIIPMGIDRMVFTQTRIAGVAANAEYLFVLRQERYKKILRQEPIREPGEYEAPGYSLAVFRLTDGTPVQNVELKRGDFPTQPTATDTLKPGPLTLKQNGVAVFGVTYTFKGTELIEERPEKKPGQ